MGLLRYWRTVLRRAWQEAWRVVIPHTPVTLARDALFLLIAGFLLWWYEVPLVARGLTSPENLQDTFVWIVFVLTAVVTVFAAAFVVEGLFVVPYTMWKEVAARHGLTSSETSPEIILHIEKSESGNTSVPSHITWLDYIDVPLVRCTASVTNNTGQHIDDALFRANLDGPFLYNFEFSGLLPKSLTLKFRHGWGDLARSVA